MGPERPQLVILPGWPRLGWVGAPVAGYWYLKGAFVAPGFLKAPFRYLPTGTPVIHSGVSRENGGRGIFSPRAPVFVAPWCRERLGVQGERRRRRP